MQLKRSEIEEYIPKPDYKKIRKYINDELFKDNHYLFIKNSKAKMGYCENCHNKVSLKQYKTKVRHNQKIICPHCHREVTVKNAAIGSKNILNKGYFIEFFKSPKDKTAIAAIGFLVYRDYYNQNTAKYKASTQIIKKNKYVFIPGMGGFGIRGNYSYLTGQNYTIMKKITPSKPATDYRYSWRGETGVDKDSLYEAITGTPFQYNAYKDFFDGYEDEYIVTYLAKAAKYPAVEYIEKLGMKDIVFNPNMPLNRLFNMRGKNLKAVMRVNIDKKDLAYIRKDNQNAEKLIPIWQQINKKGKYYHLEAVAQLVGQVEFCDLTKVKKLLSYMSFEQLVNHKGKYTSEYRKRFTRQERNGYADVISDYLDYIKDCKQLGMDIKDKSVLFPTSLYRAHINTMKQIEFKENEALNAKIRKRVKSLKKKYSFTYNGLMIVVPTAASDLVIEGKHMHNCVGTYAKSHADKQTTILFIRKVNNPEESYHTLEIMADKIIQCRSFANGGVKKDVEKFLKEFEIQKLTHVKVKIIKASEFVERGIA